MSEAESITPRECRIAAPNGVVEGELHFASPQFGLAIIAHGTSGGPLSPRNRFVARLLRECGFGTFLVDVVAKDASGHDEPNSGAMHAGELIEQMAAQLEAVGVWLAGEISAEGLAVGYLGSGDAGSAGLLVAARRPELVRAVVTRGAAPTGILHVLPRVETPTLLIVGSRDLPVLEANREALKRIGSLDKSLEIVPGADHQFEEPGALAAVALHSANWFAKCLAGVDRATALRRRPGDHVALASDSGAFTGSLR